MPASSENESVSKSEYQALQRKFDRRDRTAKALEQRLHEVEAGSSRVEALLENLTSFLAGDDAQLKTAASRMLGENASKRTLDKSAAELQSRLNQVLDGADEDWEDPKFAPARKILEEINRSGDMSRSVEVERLMRDAITPPDNRSEQERIDAAVTAAIAAERKGTRRVDTGESSNVRDGGNVSRSDLGRWKPSDGIDSLKSRLDQAMKQISS